MSAHYDFELGPIVAIWELTRACELACIHCRASAQPTRSPKELTTEEGFDLIEEISKFDPRPILILTGGDPLMRPDIYDLVSFAVKRGLQTSVAPSVTSRLDKEAMERLKDCGINRVGISLDGAAARTHDGFRGVLGSYESTMRALAYAGDVGLQVQLQTTVSRHNLGELSTIGQIAKRIGAVLWNLFFLVPTGRAKREDMITPEEHELVFRWLLSFSRDEELPVKTTEAPHFRRVLLQEGPSLVRPFFAVNDAKGFCFVSHVGDICPSGFLPLAAGNVRDASIGEIYRDSALFRELRNPDLLRGKCGICRYRWICGGSRARAYAVTGDYLAEEPCCVYDPAKEIRRTWCG